MRTEWMPKKDDEAEDEDQHGGFPWLAAAGWAGQDSANAPPAATRSQTTATFGR